MLKLYYMLWSDMILTARKNGNFTDKWKEFKYVLPIFQGLNLAFVDVFIKVVLDTNLPLSFEIDIFAGKILDSAFVGITTLFLPFYILNYFLIFRNNRYERIIVHYKCYNGKFLFRYIGLSVLTFLLPLIIGKSFGLM